MNDERLEPQPDDKDWTWVIEQECPECGFDASRPEIEEFAAMFRAMPGQWRGVLEGEQIHDRPAPAVWSPLEYSCHVRDVLALTDYRVGLMRDNDDPLFANWDQDETAIASDYPSARPSIVADEISANAETVASAIDALDDSAWPRPGRRSNGSRFTIESFVRYILHDPIHHYWDVTGERWHG